MAADNRLIEVKDVKTHFFLREDGPGARRGRDRAGEALGVVGESGCGKSVTVTAILRIVPSRGGSSTERSRSSTPPWNGSLWTTESVKLTDLDPRGPAILGHSRR